MAQTTEHMPFIDADVDYSTDGTTFTACSGNVLGVAISGGERQSADTHTGDASTPLLTFGPKGSLEVTVGGVYTGENAGDALTAANTAYEADSAFYFRWYPNGKTVGQPQYTTSEGRVMKAVYPGGQFSSADAITAEIVVRCATITPGTYSTT